MKVLIAFEANETFDMEIVAHCLNKILATGLFKNVEQ